MLFHSFLGAHLFLGNRGWIEVISSVTSLWTLMSVGWLVGQLVGALVCLSYFHKRAGEKLLYTFLGELIVIVGKKPSNLTNKLMADINWAKATPKPKKSSRTVSWCKMINILTPNLHFRWKLVSFLSVWQFVCRVLSPLYGLQFMILQWKRFSIEKN